MRLHHRPLAILAIACCALGACGGDDKPAASGSGGETSIAQATADTSGSTGGVAATQPAGAGGDVDCAALKDNLANMLINWQVVIGLSNTPAAEWAGIPLGSIDKFDEQLAGITAALGSDADAAASLSYMSGADDIVERGLGGDSAAQADLAAYMGTDIGTNVGKQLPISIAYQNAGCT